MSLRVVDLPASAGWRWISGAMKMFGAQPFAWVALSSCWLLFSLLAVGMFSAMGLLLVATLQPAVTGGMLIAAAEQERGGRVTLTHLIAGFRANGGNLVRLGMLWVVGMFAVVLLIFAVGIPTPPETIKTVPEMAEWLRGSLGFGAAAVALIGVSILQGILWFAVPVAALHGLKPMESIRWSGYALVANMGAMLGFCLPLVVMFVALFVVGSTENRILSIVGSFAQLVITAIVTLASYVSYRQVFATQTPSDPPKENAA
jgi:hypothetical protein